MATHLDLEEQEQLERLKHFWKQYGNLITWTLVLVLAGFAAWNGWNLWQRDQAVKAGALYEALDVAAATGDAEQVQRAYTDLRERHGRTAYAAQGALLAARVLQEQGKPEAAVEALRWAADKGSEAEYQAIARLRLAGLLLDSKSHDEALKVLSGKLPQEFEALAADRRGDIHLSQGNREQAVAQYRIAYKGLDDSLDYRNLVAAKLTSLGAAPDDSAADKAKP